MSKPEITEMPESSDDYEADLDEGLTQLFRFDFGDKRSKKRVVESDSRLEAKRQKLLDASPTAPLRTHHRLVGSGEVDKEVLTGQGEELRTLWISNLDESTTEAEIRSLFVDTKPVDVRMVHDHKGVFKGFAYVDFSDEVTCQRVSDDTHLVKSIRARQVKALVSRPSKPIYEPRTAFLKNVPCVADSIIIAAIEGELGCKVEALRMIPDVSGQHKGYGYADFASEALTAEGIRRGTITVDGHPIQVLPCVPLKSHRKIKAPKDKCRNAAAIRRKEEIRTAPVSQPDTIFVKDIAFSATEREVQAFFEENAGPVVRTKLVT
ncbi:MAG: hypothetical protein KVP17_000241 [Porospora cf. gigantea B]|uniref:uncharacterized protein n=2 Tax=Porospora cf. gigantea B TaxID=2853592 RepID=UPI003571D738|nr:MAG: hypothetical protein KVP17_000241 [Porospora cf. gigantea B]